MMLSVKILHCNAFFGSQGNDDGVKFDLNDTLLNSIETTEKEKALEF